MTATMYEEMSKATLQEILCLATLFTSGTLPRHMATQKEANRYFERVVTCDNCPNVDKCLAVLIEE